MKFVVFLVYLSILSFSSTWIYSKSANAISSDAVIFQLQAGTSSSASNEIVLIYNHSKSDINVSGWCLHYSSASNSTKRLLACIEPDPKTELWLQSGGFISFASAEFTIANPGFVPDFSFVSGMASTGGHVWIEDSLKSTIDRLGWGTAVLPETSSAIVHDANMVLSRNLISSIIDSDNNLVDFSSQILLNPIPSNLYEKEVVVDLCPNIPNTQEFLPEKYLQDEQGDCYEDMCFNIDDLQKVVPQGYDQDLASSNCKLIPLEDSVIIITELLPNFASSDTGNEFIEIYNPNSFAVNLKGYKLQVGPSYTKQFIFGEMIIEARSYMFFSDIQTGIVLPNSNGVQLRILSPAGTTVDQTAVYSNAEDDVSWALVEDNWIYTNQITPGSSNLPYEETVINEEINVTTVLAPCPVGKYRNPETNRCRNIETAVSSLIPCDEDEYRNPETNRCRKITTASVLAACAEGQERNPETNRCRKITNVSDSNASLTTVEDIKVDDNIGSINWLVVSLAIIGTFCYIFYEWRYEIRQKFISIRN